MRSRCTLVPIQLNRYSYSVNLKILNISCVYKVCVGVCFALVLILSNIVRVVSTPPCFSKSGPRWRGPNLILYLPLHCLTLAMCAFSPHLTFSSRALVNTEYMYELFFPSFPSSVFLCDCLILFPSPLIARPLCLGSAPALSSNSICQSALGSQQGKRGLSPLYCLAASPLYCFTESRVFSRARQTWRKLQRCQISHKLPDLPRHGNKRKFQQWLFMGFVRVQYSGHSALAELCLESSARFLLTRFQCRTSLLN